jgi:putative lipase involved disintegration of autophagic bodies
MEGLTDAQKVIREYDRRKGERVNWDEYWEDLAEYFLPNKDNVYGYKLQGERKHNQLYDSTSIMALEMLASSLHGMLTNLVQFGLVYLQATRSWTITRT